MDVLTDGFTDNSGAFLFQMYRVWLFPFHFHTEKYRSEREYLYRAVFVKLNNTKKNDCSALFITIGSATLIDSLFNWQFHLN